MAPRSRIIGCGSYLPERVLTNDELARKLDTSDEWITARTGIRQRHIAAAGELTSDLAYQAARQALESAAIGAEELDLIVLATTTPDNTFPATATKVQALLEVNRGAAFDVQAVCTGFLFALSTADSFIRTGQARTALVLGAETFSRIVDWRDRSTCVIFGDGAGAVVVRAGEEGEGGGQERGILSFHLHSDGRLGDLLFVDGGPSSTQTVGTVKMSGREVFRHAVVNLADVALEALEANGLTIGDVDWLVPHQANKRILESTARKLGLPAERVVVTVDRHANTSAASIPLALEEAVGDGRIRPGHLVLMEAMGAGMTWGAGLVRW
ncbi:MAG: beta-ketoacyl-ACP synthase III [Rhodospirillales bacterium]|jgi:3-oxoacyl-[acyl-carrier-protein] synthase-3|nr:beta-ketoacyl-ACP synthase III [Rhodospirillales bacterium]HIJ43150.1 ketoacyl-ACP synthase III [Rhodospirillaceae bacterium]MDP7215035.1 beta-ketoacyl-ACP synthase III [Rhodospirillales bacterium]HIJ46297.1 ketoacyl-ACP synthase III [Rhodospirillaceae bacterium]HIJ93388.1 ketoacyl-ACP synthase III [Rhodospirillaceae bacterium]